MEENKLISMIDFVLQDKSITGISIINYAYFLKKPLELWMFVPCDEYGNVLEEINDDYPNNIEYFEEIEQYNKAKERCLFEGFEIKHHHSSKKSICTFDNFFHIFWNTNDFWELSKGIFTIEDLVKYNLQLTKTA